MGKLGQAVCYITASKDANLRIVALARQGSVFAREGSVCNKHNSGQIDTSRRFLFTQ